MAQEKLDDLHKFVSKATIGKLFGLSTRRIEQLKADGIINGQGRPTRYILDDTVQAYVKHLSDKATNRLKNQSTEELEQEKLAHDVQIKKAKAAMEALKAAELAGDMYNAADIEAVHTDMLFAVKAALDALPGRVAMDVAKAKTAAEAEKIVRREVHLIEEDLAGYQYDPDVYAQRLRERIGWKESFNDDAEE